MVVINDTEDLVNRLQDTSLMLTVQNWTRFDHRRNFTCLIEHPSYKGASKRLNYSVNVLCEWKVLFEPLGFGQLGLFITFPSSRRSRTSWRDRPDARLFTREFWRHGHPDVRVRARVRESVRVRVRASGCPWSQEYRSEFSRVRSVASGCRRPLPEPCTTIQFFDQSYRT